MKRNIYIITSLSLSSVAGWSQEPDMVPIYREYWRGRGQSSPRDRIATRHRRFFHWRSWDQFYLSSGSSRRAHLQLPRCQSLFPNGEMRLWAFTANPVVRSNCSGRVDCYLIGGGGVYHRTMKFGQPVVATYTVYDPFGLTISARLAAAMDALWVESTLGDGSCFHFTIRLEATTEEAAVIDEVSLSGMAILIIDDNLTKRQILTNLIAVAGAADTGGERSGRPLADASSRRTRASLRLGPDGLAHARDGRIRSRVANQKFSSPGRICNPDADVGPTARRSFTLQGIGYFRLSDEARAAGGIEIGHQRRVCEAGANRQEGHARLFESSGANRETYSVGRRQSC